jgi:tetratricopeptide (TPR) repeat protein
MRATLIVSLTLCVCHGGGVCAQSTASASADEILDLAVKAYGETDYSTAEAMLLRIWERSANHREVAFWLGCTYQKQEKWDQAIQVFTRMRELDPMDSRPPGLLGQIYLDTNQPIEAVRWYRLAVGLAPKDKGLLKNLEEAENAVNRKKPWTALSLSQFGFVSQVNDSVRVWAHFAGVVAFLLVPAIAFHIAIKAYRVPLTPSELWRVFLVVALAAGVCYLTTWGWQPHWRMVLFGPGVLLLAWAAYRLARRMSVLCIVRVVDGAARLAFLARLLQAMRRNARDE